MADKEAGDRDVYDLSDWQRIAVGVVGGACLGVGGNSYIQRSLEGAATVTLLIIAALLLFIAIYGRVPSKVSKDSVQFAERALKKAADAGAIQMDTPQLQAAYIASSSDGRSSRLTRVVTDRYYEHLQFEKIAMDTLLQMVVGDSSLELRLGVPEENQRRVDAVIVSPDRNRVIVDIVLAMTRSQYDNISSKARSWNADMMIICRDWPPDVAVEAVLGAGHDSSSTVRLCHNDPEEIQLAISALMGSMNA